MNKTLKFGFLVILLLTVICSGRVLTSKVEKFTSEGYPISFTESDPIAMQYLNQAVKITSSPTFADLTLTVPSNIYSLNHDSFSGFVANEHINHTGVTLTLTSPLSGSGDISTNRTFSLAGLSSLGTANYIVGVNSGATGWEYNAVTGTGNVVRATSPALTTSAILSDGFTLGLGSGKGLIQFDDETTDFVSFSNCNVGIGTMAPSVKLDVAGQGKFTSTAFPVVDIYRDTTTSAGYIWGGAKLERLMTGGTATAGTGIGFYFKAPDSTGASTFAGMFGGALSTVTNDAEVGNIVFGASWLGVDPYQNQHLIIRATGASTGNVLIPNGNVGIGTTGPAWKLSVIGDVNVPASDDFRIAGARAIDPNAYGSGWNGSLVAPNRNVLYDYLHLLDTNDDGDIDTIDATLWATKQAVDADLTAISALSTTGFARRTATNTWSTDANSFSLSSHNHSGVYEPAGVAVADITDASANGRSLISAANYAAMRALIDLEIGTDVQAYDADLTTYSGITPSANAQTLLGETFAQMLSSIGLGEIFVDVNVISFGWPVDPLIDKSDNCNVYVSGRLGVATNYWMKQPHGEGASASITTGNDKFGLYVENETELDINSPVYALLANAGTPHVGTQPNVAGYFSASNETHNIGLMVDTQYSSNPAVGTPAWQTLNLRTISGSDVTYQTYLNPIADYYYSADSILTGHTVFIDSNDIYYYSRDGNFGINTIAPLGKLHVVGSGTVAGVVSSDSVQDAMIEGPDAAFNLGTNPANLTLRSNSNFAVDKGGTLGLGGSYTTGNRFWANFAIIKGAKENGTIDNTASYLAFGTRGTGANITEKMRIDSTGKVGIGTTVPKSSLHVVGLPVYANNAAAVAGGLTAGAFYQNNGDPSLVCVVK